MSINWEVEVSNGLSPLEVSAGLITSSILTSDLPDIAAWWLVDGRDTPALRELAGGSSNDFWTLDSLWRRVCDEVGVVKPEEARATEIDVRRILATWQAGRFSTSDVLSELDRMSLYRFAGLDVTAGLLDEIEGGWGRRKDEVFADASERLSDLASSLGPRPTWK